MVLITFGTNGDVSKTSRIKVPKTAKVCGGPIRIVELITMSKNQKIVWWVVGIVVVVGLVWWGVSKNSGSGNVIKIGWIGPLTGDVSSIGTVNKAAVQVAVDEVNAAGGVNGKQIQMFYEDAQCNAQLAVSAAQKLVSIDGVGIIISECSTETSAFGPMAMQDKVIVFSPVSSAPSLSQLGKYFFRDYPSDSFAGKFEADYAYNKLGARKVAILYHVSDYGTGLKDVFTQEFQSLGGTIVDVEGASADRDGLSDGTEQDQGLEPRSDLFPDVSRRCDDRSHSGIAIGHENNIPGFRCIRRSQS